MHLTPPVSTDDAPLDDVPLDDVPLTTGTDAALDATLDAALEAECRRLLGFGPDVVHPLGGAAWLGDDGTPDLARPVHTWITSRMVHVHSLGVLLGVEGCHERASGTLDGLRGVLRDREHGGWWAAVAPDGAPLDGPDGTAKSCYAHAFVALAASSATAAGLDGGEQLLDEAAGVLAERFWEEDTGRVVDEWDRAWTRDAPYRGLNSTMHALEAMLAVGDVTGDPVWHERCGRTAAWVVDLATAYEGRLPEHFDRDWGVDLELNRDRPDDPFKPYGATVGHALEWSRLLVQVEATLGPAAPPGLLPAAELLLERAVADGWDVDGAPGFVYTTDWEGRPVVRQRMHWVAAEAVAAAAALHRRTGRADHLGRTRAWWAYVEEHLVDRERGSWYHELDPTNTPQASVWPGKPDLYHAVQATLLPRLPSASSLASALAARGDDPAGPAGPDARPGSQPGLSADPGAPA